MDYLIAALVLIVYLVLAILASIFTCYVLQAMYSRYDKWAATRKQGIRIVLLITAFLVLLSAVYVVILANVRGFLP